MSKRPAGAEISSYEKVELRNKLSRQEESIEHCQHVLSVLTTRPTLWSRPEFKAVREAVQLIKTHPDQFAPVVGDNMPDGTLFSLASEAVRSTKNLSPNYISSIAEFKDVGTITSPILQVVSATMAYETAPHQIETNAIHFTHLRLCDANSDVMVGRLSMHLSHEGNKLRSGDIIELGLFTPIQYTPSGDKAKVRMPAVVIHTYNKVGYDLLPNKLNDPMRCVDISTSQVANLPLPMTTDKNDDDEFEQLLEVDCTHENRYCSVHGVNAVICICQANPPSKIDLEMVRQFCYFATSDAANMKNHHRRNMLYWWYMTNHYNICGKGKRADPPACLKAAIRKAYPDPDGKYTKFKS